MRYTRCFAAVLFVIFYAGTAALANNRPSLLITAAEAESIRDAIGKYPLLDRAFHAARDQVAFAMAHELDVPRPGEAGSAAHERHKQNYRDMQQAGLLYAITGESKYADFVRNMLDRYATLYPTLGPHPLSKKQVPGRLFHQNLNESVWLVYASQAYDCVYNALSAADRERFERDLLRPMAAWLSVRNPDWFNKIHNHGTWAAAAVGMLGYALRDAELVKTALYGTKHDGSAGFLKQLEMLFSPDGYYMEGPYYIRYALRPFFLFAEATERNNPDLGIYEVRDRILRKVFYATAKTIFPNGAFPPINDASRSMSIRAPGPLVAHNFTYVRYGGNDNMLAIADMQGQVFLSQAGLQVARDHAARDAAPSLNWPSVELADGHDGLQGGLGILRSGAGASQTMLLMKYGVHGEGHGHFDKLHFSLFDGGSEVVRDYGFARWINIEPKFGGRYLPENNSYAKQTIAHNTVVVDGRSHFDGDRRAADRHWGERHFFDSADAKVQIMSARMNKAYDGVSMQRTMLLVRTEPESAPTVVDLFRLTSPNSHRYDYPVHYDGQFMTTNATDRRAAMPASPLGDAAGYEHIWQLSTGNAPQPFQFTWLAGNRYYTLHAAVSEPARAIWGRTGANDPDFNLRSEPVVILRASGKTTLFAAALEPHGYFNEADEKSDKARPSLAAIRIVGHDDAGSVVELESKSGTRWQICVTNGPADRERLHRVEFAGRMIQWQGNYDVRVLE